MAGITERNKQKLELVNNGFSLGYMDEWQPKVTLYRHKANYSVGGRIDQEVGTTVQGVPGNPDYVLRKAKIGLFPWPPSTECECQWCTERTSEGLSKSCDHCDFVPKGETPAAIASSLRMHIQHRHDPVESA